MRLMDSDTEVSGPINIGNPVETPIGQLAENVKALVGGNRRSYHPLPGDDPLQRCPDITARGRP